MLELSQNAGLDRRPYLFSLAYRMLGSVADAEDIVQEAYVRSQATPSEPIRSPKAYLTAITTRLCLDQLQRARRSRELYVGPWLPEPIRTESTIGTADPEHQAVMQESISQTFLIVLEQLQPFERAVFLLREVFDYEYAEIAAMLHKREAACRRSFSRAKLHLRADRPRFAASPQLHRRLLHAYIEAVEQGDLGALTALLTEDVSLWTDGGGKSTPAAQRPIRGRETVARSSLASRRFWPANYRIELAEVNGQVGAVIHTEASVFAVLTVELREQQVHAIRILLNPDKLERI